MPSMASLPTRMRKMRMYIRSPILCHQRSTTPRTSTRTGKTIAHLQDMPQPPLTISAKRKLHLCHNCNCPSFIPDRFPYSWSPIPYF